jgi:hypothetical protein
MIPRNYCVTLDAAYSDRVRALGRSLITQSSVKVKVFLLLIDDSPGVIDIGFPVTQLHWRDVADSSLLKARDNRSHKEFAWTCGSWFMNYLLGQGLDEVTHLDGDLFFFGDAEVAHREIGDAEIAVTPHRFAEQLKWRERFGLFNPGWVTIKNTDVGRACALRWARQALEWCYDKETKDNLLADQKYVDEWPTLYGTKFFGDFDIGINCAPWNAERWKFEFINGIVCVNGVRVICYHFHEFKDCNFLSGYPVSDEQRRLIYEPYIRFLTKGVV